MIEMFYNKNKNFLVEVDGCRVTLRRGGRRPFNPVVAYFFPVTASFWVKDRQRAIEDLTKEGYQYYGERKKEDGR